MQFAMTKFVDALTIPYIIHLSVHWPNLRVVIMLKQSSDKCLICTIMHNFWLLINSRLCSFKLLFISYFTHYSLCKIVQLWISSKLRCNLTILKFSVSRGSEGCLAGLSRFFFCQTIHVFWLFINDHISVPLNFRFVYAFISSSYPFYTLHYCMIWT